MKPNLVKRDQGATNLMINKRGGSTEPPLFLLQQKVLFVLPLYIKKLMCILPVIFQRWDTAGLLMCRREVSVKF